MNRNAGEQQKELPFNFIVTLIWNGRTVKLYKGKSTKQAVWSYWQAVFTMRFLGLSARVENNIHVRKEPFGGYRTDLDDGRETAMHIPYGRCADWPGVKAWSVDLMKQHLLATVYEDPNLMDTSEYFALIRYRSGL
jgi:hypothetical protein